MTTSETLGFASAIDCLVKVLYTATFGGWGTYCATKFALAALTESLAAEAKPSGVNATLGYPGYFRTDFLSKVQ